jgi:hypothetical protein
LAFEAGAHAIALDPRAVEPAGISETLEQDGKADDHVALLSDADRPA